MLVDEFIRRAVTQYESISLFDSLRSCMPLYFLFAFLILYAGGMIAMLSGVKGGKWVLLFSVIMVFTGWSWVKLYQYYELKTPVKKKAFDYRLAQAVSVLRINPEIVRSGRGVITGTMAFNGGTREIEIRYHQDLWRNVGGIVPGTPVQMLRKIHSRTWFLEIRGKTATSGGPPAIYDFSARKEDDDSESGFGIFLYDAKTHKPIDPKTSDQKKLIRQIRKTIDGTILKGSLILANGEFILKIFDNLENIRRWRKPAVVFKSFRNGARLESDGIVPEQAAFYGAREAMQLF